MPVLPDHWIKQMARAKKMIVPFVGNKPRKGKISYGTSSYGYDLRLGEEFKIPQFDDAKCLDPKKIDQMVFSEMKGPSCLIPANSFVLGKSLEYFRIPRNILALCQGKSTYARCGLVVNVTPLEPEWEGFITMSLINTAAVPLKVYAAEGIAQLIFLRAESECRISYADRKGKYQAQQKIELAKV